MLEWLNPPANMVDITIKILLVLILERQDDMNMVHKCVMMMIVPCTGFQLQCPKGCDFPSMDQ